MAGPRRLSGAAALPKAIRCSALTSNNYDQLFEERLDLFAKLVREKEVTWSGETRTGLDRQIVHPQLGPDGMVVWVGVGGSPESVVRVVRQDLQLMLAIIGGDPRRFLPYIDLYKRACAQLERPVRPDWRSLARLCRRHGRRGARSGLAALPRHVRSHRPRTRLAARNQRPLSGRGRAGFALCGIGRDGCPQDCRNGARSGRAAV